MGIPEELFDDPNSIPVRLFCTICLDIAGIYAIFYVHFYSIYYYIMIYFLVENAVVTNCDHVFCDECLKSLQKQKTSNDMDCPNCRSNVFMINPAKKARAFIGSLMVHCNASNNDDNKSDDTSCDWKGKYSMYYTHKLKSCKFATKHDKREANISFTKNNSNIYNVLNVSKDDLKQMTIKQLKNIIIQYIRDNSYLLTNEELTNTLNYKKFIEKSEYINCIWNIIQEINKQVCYGILSFSITTLNVFVYIKNI